MEDLTSERMLEAAYTWLCYRRKKYPPSADVWSFRRRWAQEKSLLQTELREGQYRFQLLTRVTLESQEEIDLWSARDAVVLKCLALALARSLPCSERCFHLKGSTAQKKGSKAALRSVIAQLPCHQFVLKSDVRSYYASVDHDLLLDLLAVQIQDRLIVNLIGQYLRHCTERGGLFWEARKGICLGCPLSPVLGAFFCMNWTSG